MNTIKTLRIAMEKDASLPGDMAKGVYNFVKKQNPWVVLGGTAGLIGAGALATYAAKKVLPTFLIWDQSRKNEAMDYQTMLLRQIADSVEKPAALQPPGTVPAQKLLVEPLE